MSLTEFKCKKNVPTFSPIAKIAIFKVVSNVTEKITNGVNSTKFVLLVYRMITKFSSIKIIKPVIVNLVTQKIRMINVKNAKPNVQKVAHMTKMMNKNAVHAMMMKFYQSKLVPGSVWHAIPYGQIVIFLAVMKNV